MQNDQAADGGYVYVLEAVGSGWVKIGVSQSPMFRTETLQTGCPFPLRIRACFWAASPRELENSLHEACKGHRGIGEWFSVDSDVVKRLMSPAGHAIAAGRLKSMELEVRCRDRQVEELRALLDSLDPIPF